MKRVRHDGVWFHDVKLTRGTLLLRTTGEYWFMAKAAETLGYYTVIEDQDTGWTGGLLLLNQAGRPLEFQCTLPVRPSRAHEILFGATLREHVISEVIGKLLIDKCRNPISMLCCDMHEAVALSKDCSFPVIFHDESRREHDEAFERFSRPRNQRSSDNREPSSSHSLPSLLHRHRSDASSSRASEASSVMTEVSGASFRIASSDRVKVESIVAGLGDLPDGAEPFERIREAIKEAQSQISRATTSRPASAA